MKEGMPRSPLLTPCPPLPPRAVRVNDTEGFGDEEGGEDDNYVDFDDISEI